MKSPRRTSKISNGTSLTIKCCNGCSQKLFPLISQILQLPGGTTRSCYRATEALTKAVSPHLGLERRPPVNTGTSSSTTTSSVKRPPSPKPKWKQPNTGSRTRQGSRTTRTRAKNSLSERGGKPGQPTSTDTSWRHYRPPKKTSPNQHHYTPTVHGLEDLLGTYDRRLSQILMMAHPNQFSLNGFLFRPWQEYVGAKANTLLAVTISTTPLPQA